MSEKTIRGKFELIPTYLPIVLGLGSIIAGAGVAYGVTQFRIGHVETRVEDHEVRIRKSESVTSLIESDTRAIRQALRDKGFPIEPRDK